MVIEEVGERVVDTVIVAPDDVVVVVVVADGRIELELSSSGEADIFAPALGSAAATTESLFLG